MYFVNASKSNGKRARSYANGWIWQQWRPCDRSSQTHARFCSTWGEGVLRIFMQIVVTGLLSSIKSIGRILVICVLVMSIFAIIGTILFRVCMYHYWARILCYLNLRDIFRALSSTARIPINRLRESASKCITWCFSSLMPVSRGCFSFFFQGPFLYLSYWRSVLPWGPFIQLRMKIFLLTHTASTIPYI